MRSVHAARKLPGIQRYPVIVEGARARTLVAARWLRQVLAQNGPVLEVFSCVCVAAPMYWYEKGLRLRGGCIETFFTVRAAGSA